MALNRGKLIVFEGIDGAGTTTQAKLLGQWMEKRGLSTHLTAEPTQGIIGKHIRQLLSGNTEPVDPACLALLFAADRLDHLTAEVNPKLDQGTHVVMDRYVYSSLAYQSLQCDLPWVAHINSHAPEPDLIIYLRIGASLAQKRLQSRGQPEEIFEKLNLQERIAKQYDSFFGEDMDVGTWVMERENSSAQPCWISSASHRERSPLQAINRNPRWVILDGSQDRELIHRQICALLKVIGIS